MDRWMDRWMDRCVDRWMDGQMDGQMLRPANLKQFCTSVFLIHRIPQNNPMNANFRNFGTSTLNLSGTLPIIILNVSLDPSDTMTANISERTHKLGMNVAHHFLIHSPGILDLRIIANDCVQCPSYNRQELYGLKDSGLGKAGIPPADEHNQHINQQPLQSRIERSSASLLQT